MSHLKEQSTATSRSKQCVSLGWCKASEAIIKDKGWVGGSRQFDIFHDLYNTLTITQAVIFCNTCCKVSILLGIFAAFILTSTLDWVVEWLPEKMCGANFTIISMVSSVLVSPNVNLGAILLLAWWHDPKKCDATIQVFRGGSGSVLIITDVWAWSIDVRPLWVFAT